MRGGWSPLSENNNNSVISDHIPQLDGNITIDTQSESLCDIECLCCDIKSESNESEESQNIENQQKIPVHLFQNEHNQIREQISPPPWFEQYEARRGT